MNRKQYESMTVTDRKKWRQWLVFEYLNKGDSAGYNRELAKISHGERPINKDGEISNVKKLSNVQLKRQVVLDVAERQKNKWSPAETEYLNRNLDTANAASMAKLFKRTVVAVRTRINNTKVEKRNGRRKGN